MRGNMAFRRHALLSGSRAPSVRRRPRRLGSPRALVITVVALCVCYAYREEALVSLMPALMPSAPAGAAARLAPSGEDGLSGFWARMDVRDASTLSEDEFEAEYMNKGRPVVIRNDPGARAVAQRINVSTLLEQCGDQDPELGRRLVEPLKALPAVVKLELSRRLYETHGVTLTQAVKVMEGRGKIKTVRDFFESDYFTTVRTAQDPRFPGAKKDFSHPADYIWPPSIHSWPIHDNCSPLLEMMAEVAEVGTWQNRQTAPTNTATGDPLPRLGYVPRITRPHDSLDIPDLFVFASGDRCRPYHPHIHGRPNHVVLLLLQGYKRAVVWPRGEANNLYPFMGDGKLPENDIGEMTPIFMANGFEVDLEWQPDLASVKGGQEGVAGPGDLLYVPCGSLHSLGNLGNMLAIGWIPTGYISNCPNANGVFGTPYNTKGRMK